ncbi:MAG TPA: F0F1 ATP synthase subunit A [Bryobacteraceae bacterium]|nr:F0F1 ATP synthase subunit A [Bryobacteraceae bacterium]
MAAEHELALTALFNEHLAGPANAVLRMVGVTAENPQRPWENWIVMELLVVALIMITVAILRTRLSAENPGVLQHIFELIYEFIDDTIKQVGVHHGERFIYYVGTIFIFILSMNLIGLVPGLESPTNYIYVTVGLAVPTFLYYNFVGLREFGFGYLKQFMGPVAWLAPLMIPIEIISHFVRPLSLSVRLFGNMFAGEQVTGVFLRLTYVVIPVIFMLLHVFVALVQTYVFTLLTTIYLGGATSEEH